MLPSLGCPRWDALVWTRRCVLHHRSHAAHCTARTHPMLHAATTHCIGPVHSDMQVGATVSLSSSSASSTASLIDPVLVEALLTSPEAPPLQTDDRLHRTTTELARCNLHRHNTLPGRNWGGCSCGQGRAEGADGGNVTKRRICARQSRCCNTITLTLCLASF
jgi:hypothetical protein